MMRIGMCRSHRLRNAAASGKQYSTKDDHRDKQHRVFHEATPRAYHKVDTPPIIRRMDGKGCKQAGDHQD